jgi:replication factor C subunit 2/4
MLWVDKYRPKTINGIIGQDEIKEILNISIKNGNMPNLLLHGPPGTGKTSTALSLVMQLYGPNKIEDNVMELNASDENGIGVIRDKIIKYASFSVGSPDPKYPSPQFKVIILDEADSMTSEAQTALKKVMEITSNITRFIIICNYDTKIIDAIKSRCADFKFNQIPDETMIKKLKNIAINEKLNLNNDVLDAITNICRGDARRSINTLQNLKYLPQKNIITVKDLYDITSFIDYTYIEQFWDSIITLDISSLQSVVVSFINSGYSTLYILNCIKDKILKTTISDKNKSNIIIHLGKIERTTIKGSDAFIQLYAVLTHINVIFRNIVPTMPEVF